MNQIEHMMKLYEEGLDELMGAQKYLKQSNRASSNEEKVMYRNMSRQELEHAQMLIRDGDRMFSGENALDSVDMVWKSLREHLLEWHNNLLKSVS